jgi:hypothetical protein
MVSLTIYLSHSFARRFNFLSRAQMLPYTSYGKPLWSVKRQDPSLRWFMLGKIPLRPIRMAVSPAARRIEYLVQATFLVLRAHSAQNQ